MDGFLANRRCDYAGRGVFPAWKAGALPLSNTRIIKGEMHLLPEGVVAVVVAFRLPCCPFCGIVYGMSLELRQHSTWWYGRFHVDGKARMISLGVKAMGFRPRTLRQTGSPAFEESRRDAWARHEEIRKELESNRTAESYLERLYELKGKGSAVRVPVSGLGDRWKRGPRRRRAGKRYLAESGKVLDAFGEWLEGKAEWLHEVTPRLCEQYMAKQRGRGISPRRYNAILIFLRAAFQVLRRMPGGPPANPFADIETMEDVPIHRVPYSPEEIRKILEAARDDAVRGLIVTAMCTAMRRGDCARLRWADVNMAEGWIRVRTSKTGETAEIPIFQMLRDELGQRARDGGEYVWPEWKRADEQNHTTLSKRLRSVLVRAGMGEQKTVERKDGLKRASVRDWHSFRTTWITLALSAGVPLPLVQRVTGHRTVDVVMRHYFRPGREAMREAIERAMPKMLTGEMKAPAERAVDRLEKMTEKNWKRIRREVIRILRGAGA